MEPMRIQKWLSQLGIASRREAETWISEGRIAVNGQVVTELGRKIDPQQDQVTVNGKLVGSSVPPRVYWLLNKPDEVLTARSDEFQRQTIYDLPKISKVPFLVSPVGRLDYRTEGLLLLTNDGELASRLTHPRFEIPRQYHVLIIGRLSHEEEQAIIHGVELEDGKSGRAEVRYAHGKNLGASRGSWYAITVFEGRNRLVRRLFEHLNHKVVRLIRVAYGEVRLPEDLEPGDYRQLTSAEIKALKHATGL
ncbi:MAG: pseudouridine synthase [Proteobacteria bacterium]|nr:pseudouridine synthase [Pseudomonadota bacterium]